MNKDKFNPQVKLTRHKELNDYLDGNFIYPINTEISVSGRCQANCKECFYSGNQSKQIIDKNIFLKFLDEYNGKAITWTGGGEPTLHPDFELFNKRTKVSQGLITNSLSVRNVKMDWIRVSKTNEPWNTGNLRRLRDMTSSLGLCINYKNKSNNDEKTIQESLDIADRLGLDYVQVRPALNSGDIPTFVDKPKIVHPKLIVSDYKFEEARRERDYKMCEGFHFVPFIWENGDVDVCGYHPKDKRYNLGNLYKESFINIINKSPDYILLDNCQRCCKNHEINRVIHYMRNLEDVNFV